MSDRLEALTEDYSRTPVPDARKVGGIRIAAIITGIVITVPVLIIRARANLSTYVILQFPFGQTGGKLVNAVVAISVLGWFAVTAAVFGDAVQTWKRFDSASHSVVT